MLKATIRESLAITNETSKTSLCTTTADEILASVSRFCQRTLIGTPDGRRRNSTQRAHYLTKSRIDQLETADTASDTSGSDRPCPGRLLMVIDPNATGAAIVFKNRVR
jgi:hypothetical protein